MHEHGIADQILETALLRAGGRRISMLRVRAGVRQGIVAGSLEQAFEHVALGTQAEGASIELLTLPATLHCRTCGGQAPTFDVLAICPQCTSDDVAIDGGDELILESLGYAAAPVA
jgi:hydrogenase nickel incorporation protein HypA/HybF